MDRKFANFLGWKRILQNRFYSSYLDSPEFKGYMTLYCMDAVREPLIVEYFHKPTCIVDAGYSWLKQFPTNEHFTVTAQYGSSAQIVAWYIDICLRHTWEGQTIGATPDGRRAGTPLSQGGNPAHGAARQGVTAAITSMTRIRYDDTAGCPVHIHLHASDTRSATQTIVSLVTGAMEMGAAHLIINLVDSITLRDAMVHPEKYADLTVRVTGYSARFVQLDPRLQEEIASRYEF